MSMKMIRTKPDHEAAMERVAELMALSSDVGSPEDEELEALALLIENYEEAFYPIDLPTPVDAIKFRMEQQGLVRKDLIPYLGSASRVSEVLNGKRKLSLAMIRKLNKHLYIPTDVLIQDMP